MLGGTFILPQYYPITSITPGLNRSLFKLAGQGSCFPRPSPGLPLFQNGGTLSVTKWPRGWHVALTKTAGKQTQRANRENSNEGTVNKNQNKYLFGENYLQYLCTVKSYVDIFQENGFWVSLLFCRRVLFNLYFVETQSSFVCVNVVVLVDISLNIGRPRNLCLQGIVDILLKRKHFIFLKHGYKFSISAAKYKLSVHTIKVTRKEMIHAAKQIDVWRGVSLHLSLTVILVLKVHPDLKKYLFEIKKRYGSLLKGRTFKHFMFIVIFRQKPDIN